MKKLSESVWGDMRKRAEGISIREEDNVEKLSKDEFFLYLKDRYEEISAPISTSPESVSKQYMSIPVYFMQTGFHVAYLVITGFETDEKKIYFNVAIPDAKNNVLNVVIKILKKAVENNFSLSVESNELPDGEKYENWFISPQNPNRKITNNFILDVLDCLLDNVKKPLIKQLKKR